MMVMPSIIETIERTKKAWDIPTKLYNDESIITLFGEISEESSYLIITQLLYLDSIQKDIDKPIKLYINSPGGVVYYGMAIVDTMKVMKRKVDIICVGIAMSMGLYILCHGTGERKALPNSRIMGHSTSGGFEGNFHDHKIDFHESEYLQNKMMEHISETTNGKLSFKDVESLFERNKYMSPEECVEFGLIDSVI